MRQLLLCGAAIGTLLLSACNGAGGEAKAKPDAATFLTSAEKELSDFSDYAARVEVSQKLLYPGKRGLKGTAAAAEAHAAELDVEDVKLQLVEAASGHVTQSDGSNSTALTCNGARHTMNVSVVVSNDYPFKAGKAFARAIVVAYNNTTDDQATAYTERTITLR